MRVTTPSAIAFNTSIDPDATIKSWSLFVTADGSLRKFFHNGQPVPSNIVWRPTEETGVLPKKVRELGYMLTVTDTNGAVVPSGMKYIPVETVTLADKASQQDKEIDRFSMILFDYNSADVTPAHQAMIDQIKSKIKPGSSTVKVIGYTDNLGDAQYNKGLSERRAKAIAQSLGLSSSTAIGLGEDAPLFSNDSPEGRFYNRTVEVIVETPRQ